MLMRGVRIGTLYKLLGSAFNNGCNSTIVPEGKNEGDRVLTVSREKTTIWHRKGGTYWREGSSTITRKNMAEGMSDYTLDFDFCEHCLSGKHNRVRFSSGGVRAKGILELIHSDVFGPVPVPSLGKSVYYVSFIDDFSRKTFIYFLCKKS